MDEEKELKIQRFQEFLRIPSVSGDGPNGSYDTAVRWLKSFVEAHIDLPFQTISNVEGKPILIVTWRGSEPSLPCIVLNSHYDVVPVFNDHWNFDPFAATRVDDGKIYARGTQDMKCVCVQYLEAIKILKSSGYIPTRTVHLLFVPDEEIGGIDGVEFLIESDLWKSMQPIGIAFDEGLANPRDAFTVFYGERIVWWLLVKAQGPTGHGSRFIENTAMSKLIDVCSRALDFREQQKKELGSHEGCSHARAKLLGDVTTLNLTMLRGGVSVEGDERYSLNVIPTEAHAGFDVRISPNMKPEEFRRLIDDWCKEEGVTWNFAPWSSPIDEHYLTSIDRDENPWWGIFLDTMSDIGIEIEPEIFPAATDSRFLRKSNVKALGFSPIRKTPILLHEHNEWIHEDTYLEGIEVYVKLIKSVAGTAKLNTE